MSSILVDASNLYVSTDITYNYMTRWAGMGLKNKGGLGIGYQLNFNHGWGRVQVHVKHYQKTFASPAKWSIDPKVSNMCYYNIKFSMATDFFGIFIICQASNQSIMSLRLSSTTVYLIPYPGIEEQIPVLPSQIQVPVPALMMHLILTMWTISSLILSDRCR